MEGGAGRWAGVSIRGMVHLFESATARCRARGIAVGGPGGFKFSISVLEVHLEKVRDLLVGITPVDLASWVEYGGGGGGAQKDHHAPRAASGWAAAAAKEAALQASADGEVTVREGAGGRIEVPGLTNLPTPTLAHALLAVKLGAERRVVGSHALNVHSSRSHMIIRVTIEGPALGVAAFLDPERLEGSGGGGAMSTRRFSSVLHFVDLAGSERVGKTGAEGARLREASHINSSLSALGNVISALRTRAPHVPYRDSKLTFLLKDTLAGASPVLLLACVSGMEGDSGESANTLNFAARCRATALALYNHHHHHHHLPSPHAPLDSSSISQTQNNFSPPRTLEPHTSMATVPPPPPLPLAKTTKGGTSSLLYPPPARGVVTFKKQHQQQQQQHSGAPVFVRAREPSSKKASFSTEGVVSGNPNPPPPSSTISSGKLEYPLSYRGVSFMGNLREEEEEEEEEEKEEEEVGHQQIVHAARGPSVSSRLLASAAAAQKSAQAGDAYR